MRSTRRLFLWTSAVLAATFAALFFSHPSAASTTNGTIDATSKYAWGGQVGWVNFGTSGGNVHVTDSALTGYAWSEHFGWINLAPTQSGVTNDGEGDLSGYAWGENLGWIDFSSTSISSAGVFAGSAVVSSTPMGSIRFDCSNCAVITDWRPASSRSSATTTASTGGGNSGFFNSGGGGGGGTASPQGPFASSATSGIPTAQPPIGPSPPVPGGGLTHPPRPTDIGKSTQNGGVASSAKKLSLFDRVKDFLGGLLFPQPPGPALPPIAELIPKKAQIVFLGNRPWNLLPVAAIRRFVFEPLPREFAALKKQLPRFRATLTEIGVARMTDVPRLVNAKISLPGLMENAGIKPVSVSAGQLALPQGIPLANLEPKFKEQIPEEIVFARSRGEKIDFPIKLVVDKEGDVEKQIRTVVGSSLSLVIKPGAPVSSVKGYLVLKTRLPEERTGSRGKSEEELIGSAPERLLGQILSAFQGIAFRGSDAPVERAENSGVSLQNLFASTFFAWPAFGEPATGAVYKDSGGGAVLARVPSPSDSAVVEERYALLSFDYMDPDGDGIYTVDVQVPRVDGEYEIITLISYVDPDLGTREIRLTAIIDPEGYIFEKRRGKETRIPDAIVSLYVLNPSKNAYELWPGREYHQENPQTTDQRGTYAFLVPQGSYYISVSAPGYKEYVGEPFKISESNEVHLNIELSSTYGWLWVVDWRTLLLIIVILLLGYNFYRDRNREGKQ